MKQIIQHLTSGKTELVEVPVPIPSTGEVLIRSTRSLISSGTEKMLVDFGKAGFIEKARQQPDKVRVVLNKARTDGIIDTVAAVQNKLNNPLPLGYCNVGVVESSKGSPFSAGERVVSNGPHAEFVNVPKNLCARIPHNVDDDTASFTVLGAIALNGIRLAQPTIGERVVVIGLGLIGLLTVQILKANGVKVLGVDPEAQRCQLASSFGADETVSSKDTDPVTAAEKFSKGLGVDSVIVTASTKSNSLMSQAANMCRKRGRIVLVGVAGLNLNRADFYEKELTFQVSCSYGPGRYDENYEQFGNDYPIGFVRWTEQRNFEAVLDLMSSGGITISDLISQKFDFNDALSAYAYLDKPHSLGLILKYDNGELAQYESQTPIISDASLKKSQSSVCVAFLGAGNYASKVLIPAFRSAGAGLHTIVSKGGLSAAVNGRKHGFEIAATSFEQTLEDQKINTIIIATRHNQHAAQVCQSLYAGKNVFVEKPIGLSHSEIEQIEEAYKYNEGNRLLMVGYNRRFSPHVVKVKSLLAGATGSKVFMMTMNAGSIPSSHWTQQHDVGGGRIIGEACHYIDLMRFLAGTKIVSTDAVCVGPQSGESVLEDKAIITLTFEDGSIGTIIYAANGGKAYPKERIEVFSGDAALQIDNFRVTKGFGWKGFRKFSTLKQEKGQFECASAFVNSLKKALPAPICFEEIMDVARATLDVAEQLRN